MKIELETIKGSGNTINLLFNEDFIIFLQYHFMPYIFIWSGFVYRQMDGANITRLSQGVIEKHFGTKRRELPKPIVPARYIISSLKTALADCAVLQSYHKSSDDIEEGNIIIIIITYNSYIYYRRHGTEYGNRV